MSKSSSGAGALPSDVEVTGVLARPGVVVAFIIRVGFGDVWGI